MPRPQASYPNEQKRAGNERDEFSPTSLTGDITRTTGNEASNYCERTRERAVIPAKPPRAEETNKFFISALPRRNNLSLAEKYFD